MNFTRARGFAQRALLIVGATNRNRQQDFAEASLPG
jgi:hypothetical protein